MSHIHQDNFRLLPNGMRKEEVGLVGLDFELKNETVLVVDDDPVTVRYISAIVEKIGFKSSSASSGKECIDICQTTQPVMVLLDINMPGMNGIEACRRLKSDTVTKDIPVIFITAFTDDAAMEDAFKSGGTDFIRKPVNPIELIARVKSVMANIAAFRQKAAEEKMKAFFETAGGICHEMNQPLQYIMGQIQLLLIDLDESDPLFKPLTAIGKKTEKMGEMTRKLLSITRYRTTEYPGGKRILDIQASTGSSKNKD